MQNQGADKENADEQAAYWFARLRSDHARAGDQARFRQWLDGDPTNEAAYARLKSMWAGLGDVAADEVVVAMRKEALALGQEPRRLAWPRLMAIAATLAVFLVAVALMLRVDLRDPTSAGPLARIAQVGQPEIYRTAVGERTALTLTDGSVVQLNTDSVLEVDYSQRRRDVRLLRGQALFDVAHDTGRPFVVEAEGQRIVAVGTSFDVRIGRDDVRVTLLEGRVNVERIDPAARPDQRTVRVLNPGEQLVATADRPFVVRTADVADAVGWRTGRVIFSDEPLGDVVEEVNRYSSRKVVLGDPALADLRVSGVFRAGAIDGFVTALDAAFPIASRADPARDEIILNWE